MWCGKLELTLSKSTSQMIMQCFPLIGLISALHHRLCDSFLHSMQMQTSLFTPYASIYASLCQLLVALCSMLWFITLEAKFRCSSLPLLSAIKIELENRKRKVEREQGKEKGERKGGRERRKKRARWTLLHLQETRDASPSLLKAWSIDHLYQDLLGRSLSTITPAHRF